MKKLFLFLFLSLFVPLLLFSLEKNNSQGTRSGFIENKGQIIDQNNHPNPSVLYLLSTPGMNVQLRTAGFSYDIYEMDTADNQSFAIRHSPLTSNEQSDKAKIENRKSNSYRFHRIDFDLLNSDPHCEIITSEPSSDRTNYYTTGTPAEGVTNVMSYQTITYKNVYPEIDLEFILNEDCGFKYNFVIHPGGILSSVQIRISGPGIELTSTGTLKLLTEIGTVEETIPLSQYTVDSRKYPVEAAFIEVTSGIYGFSVDKVIPVSATLLIDPVPTRVWGTYYGGSDLDISFPGTADLAGCNYIGGRASSLDNIATSGTHQTVFGGGTDGFIAKFTAGGSRIWGTYYGGTGADQIFGIALTIDGKLVVSGTTTSGENISTLGAFQENIGSAGVNDAFLAKFDTSGVRIWGTYYGGSLSDGGHGCAVDISGNVYLSGFTRSVNNISTPGCHQPNHGAGPDNDLFLVKFTPYGSRVWGTYYGGECSDDPGIYSNCTLDGGNFVYICGSTCSATNIASIGSFQTSLSGGADGLLVQFDTAGVRQWGTYYGGVSDDRINHVKLTLKHRIIIAGETESATGIASPGAFQTVIGGSGDAFLGRFYPNGQRHWVTYYGGGDLDAAYGGSSDANGDIYYCGYTLSQTSISSVGAFQEVFGGGYCDAILMKLDSTGNRIWGTYYGGEQGDWGYSCNLFDANHIYLSGGTFSISNIATAGSHQPVYGGGVWDGFLARFTDCVPPVVTISGNTSVSLGSSNLYTTQSGMGNYTWSFSAGGSLVSGGTSNDNTITIQWNTTGAQWVKVNYTNADGCSALVPYQLDVTVLASLLNVGFIAPDTVCVNQSINITNTTTGGSTYYWNFCSGNANNDPTGLNIGNPGALLDIPTYITLVKENNDCYSFISCQQTGVVRYYHGGSFKNNPISWTNIGKLGIIDFDQEGIQVKYDNGQWYGFVNSDTTVIRLDFGTSLANMPTAVNLNISHVFWMAHGLSIIKEGNTWLGFLTCSLENKIFRLNFGSSLSNLSPTLEDLGSSAGLISPGPICVVEENGLWYLLITAGGNTLSRMAFGNSLLNTPTGENLGNPGGFNNQIALTILRDCEATYGYYCNYIVNGQLGKLNFPSGVAGPVTGQLLGNIGNLNRPAMFSEIFRSNDTLYAYITNRGNGTLTRLTFPPCNNASVGSSTLFTPPSFSYNSTGTYNIRLIVDEGTPTQGTLCKSIVVIDTLHVSVTISATANPVCSGQTVIFTATPVNGGSSPTYQWKINGIVVGSNTPMLTYIPANGDCIVCILTSNILCPGVNPVSSNVICMIVGPSPIAGVSIYASSDTVCAGTSVTYTATPVNQGANPAYLWKVNGVNKGTNSSVFNYIPVAGDCITCTLTSSLTCVSGNPAQSNTICIQVNPLKPVSVSITTAATTVCSGTQVTFSAISVNPGPLPIYQWKVNGGIWVTSSDTMFMYSPSNGDCISAVLTSNASCATGTPAGSNTICMIVDPVLLVSISITSSANPVCAGTLVTYTATPLNGGVSPAYQWKVNGLNVGVNSSVYSYVPSNGDLIGCILTSSLLCTSNNPASSIQYPVSVNALPQVIFTSCFDTITTTNAKPIKLKGGIPLGGTYTGPAVSNGYFYPNLAGVGTKTITYSYTNAALCSASKSSRIHQFTSSPFICGNNLTDIRDGKIYPTVKIGSQCWFAENLNHGNPISSTLHQCDNCIPEKYTNPASSIQYPASVYQWDEVMRYDDTPGLQGLCPPGWHVPTEAEWNTLFANWTNSGFAGSPLKYSGYSGFNATLDGLNLQNRIWYYGDFAAFFWSSTPHGGIKAWSHAMNDFDPSVSLYPSLRSNAFNVRCIKD
jgi:uncharacterized protein (TIGR02145 family)